MPEVQNLATDPKVVERIETELIPLCKTVRDDRTKLRETWLRYYRIWSVKHDQQGYRGRTNTYIPAGRRWIENWARRIKRDLFPNTDWFDCPARHRDSESRAQGVKATLDYFFRKQMKLKRQAIPWCRTLTMYGTAPARVVWNLRERETRMLQEVEQDMAAGVSEERVAWKTGKVLDYIGPTFRPVDLFAWYVWPTTCQDVDDADLVFEDMLVSRDHLRMMAEQELSPGGDKLYVNTDKVLEMLDEANRQREEWKGGGTRDKWDAAARRLADKGFTHPLDTKLPRELRPVDLTECRWIADLDGEGAKPWLVVLGCDSVVMRVQEQPFVHGKAWWLAGKFVEVGNEFYGRGLPEIFDFMQYFANDLMNQAGDALVWAVNPITVIDMTQVQDPNTLRQVPGAKWMAPPGAVQFQQPPQGPAQAGFGALNQILGQTDAYANVTPAGAIGTAQRGRARSQSTAAGTQIMLAESAVDIQDVVDNCRVMVFEPLCYLSHTLAQQFLDRDLRLKVAAIDGAKMIETPISVADLVGDYDFNWQGSDAFENQTVRATQATNWLGMVLKIPPEMLQAAGVEIDWKYLLRSSWGAGGLGHRDADKVIRDKVKEEPMDPRLENDLFKNGRGGEIRVSPKEDHALHIKTHERLQGTDLGWIGTCQLKDHIQEHVDAMVQAEVAKIMAEQQQQLAAAGMMPGGNGNGGVPAGGGPGGRLPPPAGPGRMAQTTSLDDIFRQMPRGDAGP